MSPDFAGSSIPQGAAPGRVFVGRDRELSELRAGLEDAISGRGRLFLFAGEPGIGKTRLADELSSEAARKGARVLWGRCWERGGGAPAFWPWVRVIRSYARGREPAALARELGSGGSFIAQLVPELRELVPGLAPLPADSSLETDLARFYLFDAVASFLRFASESQGLVIVFDDLHWADHPSLLLLEFVAREIRDIKILVLGTYRELESHQAPEISELLGRLAREGRHLTVTGLTKAEVELLIHDDLRDSPHAQSVVAGVHRVTEGNPFFIDEMIRLLLAEGRWNRLEPSSWSEIGVPQGVRQTIHRRLAPLPERCREVLAVAAVAGREVNVNLLQVVSGHPPDEVVEALDDARAAGLVTEVSPALGRYRFSHALVRETLYDDLPAARRLRLHRGVGEALERAYATDVESHVAELAHHFLEAGGVGSTTKAIDYATRAARRATAQLAYEDAARHFKRALDLLEATPPIDEGHRCELLLALADVEWRTGERSKAKDRFRQAARAARASGVAENVARAALGLGLWPLGMVAFESMATMQVGVDQELVEWLEEGLRSLPEGDSALRARLLGRLAVAVSLSPETRDRRESLCRQAIPMAERIGDPAVLAMVLSCRRFALWGPDDVEERRSTARRIVDLAARANDRDQVLTARMWLLMDELELGNIAAADREIERIEQLVEELRQPLYRGHAAMIQGMRALMHGRFEEAETLAGEALLVGQKAGNELAPMLFEAQMSRIFREQGRLGELEAGFRYALDHGAALPVVRCVAAFTFAEIGRLAEARVEFERCAEGEFSVIPRDLTWLLSMFFLAGACAMLGDERRAAVLYRMLEPYSGRCVVVGPPPVACWGLMLHCLGPLAATMGRADLAARHFEDAVDRTVKIGSRLFTAHAEHAYAEFLLGQGEHQRALALLDQALLTARGLGMKALEERIVGLLEAAQVESLPETVTGTGDAMKARAADPLPRNVFRREGDYWSITHENRTFRLRDARGLRYLACLLREPGRDFHVTDLLLEAAPVDGAGPRTEPGEGVAGPGHAGEILDPQAKAEYRRRLESLREELVEAESANDPGRASRVREEIEFISVELAGAYGLGGKARKAADVAERARKAVTNRIRDGIARIRREDPALALHLSNAIRMGSFCSYNPEGPTSWEI